MWYRKWITKKKKKKVWVSVSNFNLLRGCAWSQASFHLCSSPYRRIIPIFNSCRNADDISYWVIKLGAGTLTHLHNHWHFPIETTACLQSICCPNLIVKLACSTVTRFISLHTWWRGKHDFCSYTMTHAHNQERTHTPTHTGTNTCRDMYKVCS